MFLRREKNEVIDSAQRFYYASHYLVLEQMIFLKIRKGPL
jgi:hypothetical protein